MSQKTIHSTIPHFQKALKRFLKVIDCMLQSQVRENVVRFEKALGAVKVIKDQIQYRSQSLLNLARGYFIHQSLLSQKLVIIRGFSIFELLLLVRNSTYVAQIWVALLQGIIYFHNKI